MEAITLGDIDLNCPYNCKNHNTHFFGTDKQIVRRGQAFNFYVNFQNREWDNSTDTISFTVETGLRPCESNGTKCSFSLGTCIDQSCWSACYKPHQKKCMNITLFPPTNACIGRHILNMHVTSCHHTYDRCLGDFYILFNPWCADDPVYMYNQAQREEYVLNEQGMLYQGVHKHITSRPWNFGQFEDSILDICLKVLDMGANYHHESDCESSWRNDPVQVSVVVNHMISSDGSNSIMKLPQNNDYLQGTKPQSWNGSVPILQQWYKGRCRPVRYGDSASLASVMCTVMRCLGIPSRVVTNFYSPHHAENPLVVNELFDCTGKTLRGKDSLWSYHCWNESWMSRKDLNQHCGDWQCLDPTPLETGTGSICCGPTWVRSIKDGDLDLDYDGHHIFSRLNAGCVGWLSQGSGSKTKLYYDTWPCGQYISTKSVGNDLREDITRTYKYELGSLKDKEAFYRAYRKIHSGYSDAPNSDIDRELTSLRSPFLSDAGIAMRLKMANCPEYGQDICLQWVLENLRKEPKNLNFNLCAQVMTCNGYPLDQFWKDNMNVILGPREVKTIPLHIPYDQYGPHLSDYSIIRVVAISEPGCAGEVLMGNRDIAINKPPVDIKLLGQPRLHAPCSAEISFCNPLQEDLRNCVLSLEGVGLFKEPATIDLGKLAANHQARTIVEFTPYREGCHTLLANFRCHKFGYCKGYVNANVETSVPQVVCGSPPQVVCGSPPQVVCGSPPQMEQLEYNLLEAFHMQISLKLLQQLSLHALEPVIRKLYA
nr:protein-glutamine gamma-glutamyltransferase 5 [Pelodiscus sinensis]|eukprot:XP_025039607.1 protein-glutamine gamma-glutamyltransferase 5 [Pelodiscus sinensis]